MVSINNNFGIGALRATANAATANGLNDDTGKVKTLKASEQFPQPDVQKSDQPTIYRFKAGEDWNMTVSDMKINDVVISGKDVYIVNGEQNPDGTWDLWLEEVPYTN